MTPASASTSPPHADSSDLCFNHCDQTVNVIHDHLINTTARSTGKAPPHTHTSTLAAFGSEKHLMKRLSSGSIMTQRIKKKKRKKRQGGSCYLQPVLCFNPHQDFPDLLLRMQPTEDFTIWAQTDLMSIRLLLPSSTGARLRILNAISD